MDFLSILLGTAALCLGAYLVYDRYRFKDVWSQYGVKQPRMNSVGFLDVRSTLGDLLSKNGDTIGAYTQSRGKILITRDLHLLKQILVKDFNNFANRDQKFDSKSPVCKSVFFAEGLDWKRLRKITSPSFSTGKLKGIATIADNSAVRLAQFCAECSTSGKLLPIKAVASQFSSEIIARTAFGLKTEAIGHEEHEFTKYAKSIFKVRSKPTAILMLLLRSIPGLVKFLFHIGIEFFDPVSEGSRKYFSSILYRTIPERREYERNDEKRKPNDLLQSFVSAPAHIKKASENNIDKQEMMSNDEIVGQSLLIVFAAYETTSTTLQMMLYLLARHPEVQERVYKEIKTNVSSETPTSDELSELKYMEQVINETSRLYTVVSVITRKAEDTRTYGDITIPSGTIVFIPLDAIHKDPKLWPNPYEFDPERFTEEAKAARDPMAFMPFGYGPRLCIGMRMAYLELKLALVHVLRKVRVELNDKTEPKQGQEMKISWQGVITPEKTVLLACKSRETV